MLRDHPLEPREDMVEETDVPFIPARARRWNAESWDLQASRAGLPAPKPRRSPMASRSVIFSVPGPHELLPSRNATRISAACAVEPRDASCPQSHLYFIADLLKALGHCARNYRFVSKRHVRNVLEPHGCRAQPFNDQDERLPELGAIVAGRSHTAPNQRA
jgi:hypothetical protein